MLCVVISSRVGSHIGGVTVNFSAYAHDIYNKMLIGLCGRLIRVMSSFRIMDWVFCMVNSPAPPPEKKIRLRSRRAYADGCIPHITRYHGATSLCRVGHVKEWNNQLMIVSMHDNNLMNMKICELYCTGAKWIFFVPIQLLSFPIYPIYFNTSRS